MSVGDFAMLLNAGMSAKQALVYNCVSSLLCMMGMVVGVAVGNISSATSWIFALIAGLFLYIALVDMVATYLLVVKFHRRKRCTVCDFVFQSDSMQGHWACSPSVTDSPAKSHA